jgi:maltose-binding protein MalE
MRHKVKTLAVLLFAVLLSAVLFAGGQTESGSGDVEKPTIVFWQNEAGSGLSAWYAAVVADINANEDFQVKIVENPIEDMIDKVTTAGVAQSGFDISWD